MRLPSWLESVDVAATRWMAFYGIALLRISLGIIFFWFGVLKFFPGLSPAQDLATRTMDVMTFGLVPSHIAVPALATLECAIGLGLIAGVWLRAVLLLLFFQMIGAFAPVVLFPADVFARIPYAPTLEGQYIIKNLVLISSAIVVGATVRGGTLVPEDSE